MTVPISLVIPVRPPFEGKTRLAGVLDRDERAALIRRMFRHVFDVGVAFAGARHCHVLTTSGEFLSLAKSAGANPMIETSPGLNAALTRAQIALPAERPVMTVSADLPFVSVDDLNAMRDALDDSDVVIATDHRGSGTNALLLRHPGWIPFSFGEDSCARHQAAAASRGHRFAVIRRSGLATDIDEATDLSLAEIRRDRIPHVNPAH